MGSDVIYSPDKADSGPSQQARGVDKKAVIKSALKPEPEGQEHFTVEQAEAKVGQVARVLRCVWGGEGMRGLKAISSAPEVAVAATPSAPVTQEKSVSPDTPSSVQHEMEISQGVIAAEDVDVGGFAPTDEWVGCAFVFDISLSPSVPVAALLLHEYCIRPAHSLSFRDCAHLPPYPLPLRAQLTGWFSKLPLATIQRTLQVLVPQVEKMCKEK